jgi:tetratricopeptide (TPR) repeat protein
MVTMHYVTRHCLTLLCGMFLAAGVVHAQDDQPPEQQTKEAQAVSKEVYDDIQKAQEAVDAENYQGALRILQSLQRQELTDYERANVLNYVGFVHYNVENVTEAIRAYEQLIAIPELEPQMLKQTVYTLAQLNMMEENYQKSLNYLDQWFTLEANPGPQPYILYAQNLYQVDRFDDMIDPILTAMEIARQRDVPIKEDWYVLLNFAHFQQENYAEVKNINKILLQNWPKKRYWFQLAGAYTELGEERNLIAAYDAAHTQGLLSTEPELVTMAQLYMQYEVPYKAAKLLEEEIESGRVEGDAANYRLLSQAWQLAMDDEKAIPALQEAARLDEDGELYLRLANAYLNQGDYDECASAARQGLRVGGIDTPANAQITLGMCLYNLKQYQNAIEAFRAAARTERTRRMARQWIDVIEADIERDRQIEMAEAAARRQQEQLAQRRRNTAR